MCLLKYIHRIPNTHKEFPITNVCNHIFQSIQKYFHKLLIRSLIIRVKEYRNTRHTIKLSHQTPYKTNHLTHPHSPAMNTRPPRHRINTLEDHCISLTLPFLLFYLFFDDAHLKLSLPCSECVPHLKVLEFDLLTLFP